MSKLPILAPSDTWFTQGGTSVKRASITEIHIKDSYQPSGSVTASWDASADKDGSVMAYVEGTKLTIAGNGSGKVYANPNSSWAFSDSADKDNYSKLTKFTGGNLLDTSKATTMERMFQLSSALTTIDTSNWDTSNVESMYCMFQKCSALAALDVSNWDTGSVNTMAGMFNMTSDYANTSLTSLDVSKWNTGNVTNMMQMFNYCKSLESLNTVNWDVSKVTNMKNMFNNCASLEQVNVSNWNVSMVTTMQAMFQLCESLTTIGDTTNWNPNACTNMSYMFYNCTSLEELNTINWNVSMVTTMQGMFYRCESLTSLNLTNWDVSNVANMSSMFSQMNSLEKVTLGSKFNFNGDGSTSAVLPTPSSAYIPNADGKWYTADGRSYAPAKIPNKTADTYYASKELAEATVTYDICYQTAHGTAPKNKEVTVHASESYLLTDEDLPVLSVAGYIFGGWSVNGVVISAGYEISANTTLIAVWVEDLPVSKIDPVSMLMGYMFGQAIRK